MSSEAQVSRWVDSLGALTDCMVRGWETSERPLQLPAHLTPLIRAKVEELAEAPDWLTVLDDGRVSLVWKGVSFTVADRAKFAADTFGIFGQFGVEMADSWVDAQPVRVQALYFDDPFDAISGMQTALAGVQSADDLRLALLGFAPSELDGERELRVVSGASRIRFDTATDALRVFVPHQAAEEALRIQCPRLPKVVIGGLFDGAPS